MKNNFDLELKAIVIKSFDLEAYDIETGGLTIVQQAQKVLECFSSEYDHPYNQKLFPNRQLRIAEWLKGLPTACTIPFCNNEIVAHGKRIGQLKQDATENAEQKYIDQWFALMAWKIIQLSEMKVQAEKAITNFLNQK